MQKNFILFFLCSLLSNTYTKTQILPHSSDALFIAISQGNTREVKRLLNHMNLVNIPREQEGNSPLMEAIIALGEKLIEMETQSISEGISDPKNITDDFRAFLRTFIVSLIIGVSASEIQSNIEKIDNVDNSALITLLQSLSNSFLPVVSRSAYIWCAYSLLDYGIAVGQKNAQNQSNIDPNAIDKYKKTINMLLSKPTIDVNQINNHGESALSLIREYKHKVKSGQLKIILYQIEQALLSEGAHMFSDPNINVQNYVHKTY